MALNVRHQSIRPFQLDPEVKPLFPTPDHPSYPAAHACQSGANAAILSYLFPSEASSFMAMGQQAGESRIWAGIHYRSDLVAGYDLARKVAAAVIERAGGWLALKIVDPGAARQMTTRMATPSRHLIGRRCADRGSPASARRRD